MIAFGDLPYDLLAAFDKYDRALGPQATDDAAGEVCDRLGEFIGKLEKVHGIELAQYVRENYDGGLP